MLRTSLVVVALVAAAAGSAGAQAVPPSSPLDYALFAVDDVRLRNNAKVLPGDVGSNGGIVRLDAGTRVNGDVAAFAVRLGRNGRATRFFCFFLDGPTKALCRDVVLPVVSADLLPPVQVTPGQLAVRAPRGRPLGPIAAGAYGEMRLGARSGLLLAGGTYAVRSLRLASRAQLVCQSACVIQVLERVRMGPGAGIRPQQSVGARGLRIDVRGNRTAKPFVARARTTVSGTVYAPGGRIVLGADGQYEGSFIGSSVVVGPRAEVSFPR